MLSACHNTNNQMAETIETDYKASEEVKKFDASYIAEQVRNYYKQTGKWRMTPIYNEFREKTGEMMARIDFEAYNNAPQAIYDGQVSILFIPNYGFEIHDYGDGIWGWSKLKVRDDASDEIIDIEYYSKDEVNNKYHSKDDSYSSISYIAITNPKAVRIFYNLLLRGNITLLLNKNQVCYIEEWETKGLDVLIRENGIDDKYTGGANESISFEGIPIPYTVNSMALLLEQNNFVKIKYENERGVHTWEDIGVYPLRYVGTVLGAPNTMIELIPDYITNEKGRAIETWQTLQCIRIETEEWNVYNNWLRIIASRYGKGLEDHTGVVTYDDIARHLNDDDGGLLEDNVMYGDEYWLFKNGRIVESYINGYFFIDFIIYR